MSSGSMEKTSLSVSIGMPVYNGEAYIRNAIDSLLKQTLIDFELIISDNASTDGTESICREYAAQDVRIFYFRQKKNIGAAANFQFVVNHARADFFMWAAYDDTWAESYLRKATILFDDESVDFVLPSFRVRSILLRIGKKFDRELFKFIESTDRKQRVLQFLALHHASYKCNIVYSLFRTEFLKNALGIQNIDNDGALGAVLLGLGRGRVLGGALFNKRYPRLWPSTLNLFFAWFYKNYSKEFELAKEASLKRLAVLFPEYMEQIKFVFDQYHPYTHGKGYQICSIDNGPNPQEKNNGSK